MYDEEGRRDAQCMMREGRRGAQCMMRKGRRGKFTFHAGTYATVLCVQLLQIKTKGAPE